MSVEAYDASVNATIAAGFANVLNVRLGLSGSGLRQVATACTAAVSASSSNTQTMSRSAHIMRDTVSQIIIAWPVWYVNGSTSTRPEQSLPGSAAFTAALEYPVGVLTPITFEFGRQWGIGVSGQEIRSEPIAAPPKGAQFWVRTWYSAAAGSVYTASQNTVASELMRSAAGNAVDQTQSGTISHNAGSNIYRPIRIMGASTREAFYLHGDSIQFGLTPEAFDGDGDIGIMARSIGQYYGYTNVACSGDQASFAVAAGNYQKRSMFRDFYTRAVVNYGHNDINAGRTLAQIQADLITLWGLLAPLPVYQSTITPRTTSTDGWATTANQTAVANFGAGSVRTNLNDWLRDGAPMSAGVAVATGTVGALRAGSAGHPLTNFVELADQVESARNSGLWKVDGTDRKWTTDGIHPTAYANLQVKASGVVFSAMGITPTA